VDRNGTSDLKVEGRRNLKEGSQEVYFARGPVGLFMLLLVTVLRIASMSKDVIFDGGSSGFAINNHVARILKAQLLQMEAENSVEQLLRSVGLGKVSSLERPFGNQVMQTLLISADLGRRSMRRGLNELGRSAFDASFMVLILDAAMENDSIFNERRPQLDEVVMLVPVQVPVEIISTVLQSIVKKAFEGLVIEDTPMSSRSFVVLVGLVT
jgi:hypothetical protein